MTESAGHSAKSPKQLRSAIEALQLSTTQVEHVLRARGQERHLGLEADCIKAADALKALRERYPLPDHYKVAVVGRFKAGKSTFVNELLGAKLAGVDTNPETAAVTTFREGSSVKATIRFISSEQWNDLKSIYSENANDLDAHRVRAWFKTAEEQRKSAAEKGESPIDLVQLERDYVRAGGHSITIPLDHSQGKKGEVAFRQRIKEFTSGARPNHCLVEGIDIVAPAHLLDEGIILVDTPGLDDTERFRVALTEHAVEDIDAILFLTKSGASYGQAEKDFLLTLLRKGTIKQLIIVITQVDQTYEQHVRTAEENEEPAEPMSVRINVERKRVRRLIDETLVELTADGSEASQRYREQLGEIPICFTSASNHQLKASGKPVLYPLSSTDAGGILVAKHQLLRMLSTQSRLALTARNLARGMLSEIAELERTVDRRLQAVLNVKDKEVAEQKLGQFRDEFKAVEQRFEKRASAALENFRLRLRDRDALVKARIEVVLGLAREELAGFELTDVAKHWRTRRCGRWGYMTDLSAKVANRIFPKVQDLLTELTGDLGGFVEQFQPHLAALSSDANAISEKLEMSTVVPFQLPERLQDSLKASVTSASDLVTSNEQSIVALLENFVTADVEKRIETARDQVSGIWGTGTTIGQSKAIRDFYSQLRAILGEALSQHLRVKAQDFVAFLEAEAASMPRRAIDEALSELSKAEADLRAAAAQLVNDQRESLGKLSQGLLDSHAPLKAHCSNLVELSTPDEVAPDESLTNTEETSTIVPPATTRPSTAPPSPPPPPQEASGHWWAELPAKATTLLDRMKLTDGDSGWAWAKIFRPKWVKDVTHAVIEDPYLGKSHHHRNLREVIALLLEASPKIKTIDVKMRPPGIDDAERSRRFFDGLCAALFKENGVTLNVTERTDLHDRYVMLDSGVLFKLGRGLDIYKPATGLASSQQSARKVRQCEIDCFSIG